MACRKMDRRPCTGIEVWHGDTDGARTRPDAAEDRGSGMSVVEDDDAADDNSDCGTGGDQQRCADDGAGCQIVAKCGACVLHDKAIR